MKHLSSSFDRKISKFHNLNFSEKMLTFLDYLSDSGRVPSHMRNLQSGVFCSKISLFMKIQF